MQNNNAHKTNSNPNGGYTGLFDIAFIDTINRLYPSIYNYAICIDNYV